MKKYAKDENNFTGMKLFFLRYEMFVKGYEKNMQGMKNILKVWKKISEYENNFEGIKKYFLGMKKRWLLKISDFIH
jgi:hypothetical protein